MFELTGKQKKYLRGLGQNLKPCLHIGKQGLTDSARESLDQYLKLNELVKVRIAGDRNKRKEISALVVHSQACLLVNMIGSSACFFRRNHKEKEQRIKLPEA